MSVLLINQQDIKIYRPTAELEDARINPYILESQLMDLKPVLNPALFLEFISKFNLESDPLYARYNELLFGKEYTYQGQTIRFEGVRPMLCYYTLARFVANNQAHITANSITVKTNAQSQPADPSIVRTMVNELRSCALNYQNEVVTFLERNPSTYPLYNSGGGSDAGIKKTSLNIFGVINSTARR